MLTVPLAPLAAAGVLGTVLVAVPVAARLVDPQLAAGTSPVGAAPPAPTGEPSAGAAGAARSPAGSGLPAAGATSRSPLRGGVAPGPTATRWTWPVRTTPRVLRAFDPPAQRWLAGHRGVDLAAVPGDAVVAAGSGTVTFAGPLAGRGVVTVTHGSLRTTYEPVTAVVHVGDSVTAGELIGVLAAGAGHCGGYPSCLHWGLLRGTVYLDPLVVLGVSHPILLPIPARGR